MPTTLACLLKRAARATHMPPKPRICKHDRLSSNDPCAIKPAHLCTSGCMCEDKHGRLSRELQTSAHPSQRAHVQLVLSIFRPPSKKPRICRCVASNLATLLIPGTRTHALNCYCHLDRYPAQSITREGDPRAWGVSKIVLHQKHVNCNLTGP